MKQQPIPFLAGTGYAHMDAWLQALQSAMPEEKIVAFAALSTAEKANCTVAIVANPEPADLRQLPQLQWVHSVWAGVERLVTELADTGLTIVRLVDPQLATTMAEAVLTAVLYLHRDLPAYARQQQQQVWQSRPYQPATQKTVSLLGLGALGEAAAQRLRQNGFQVCGWSRRMKSISGIECFHGDVALPQMLGKTDILICLLPLTADTDGLIDATLLAQLPPGAAFVNFARGGIVDDDALLAALDSGHLSHAVLDVFQTEPLPVPAWQWRHPAVTVLPHCTAPTDRSTASAIVAANIRQFRRDGTLPACVDRVRGY